MFAVLCMQYDCEEVTRASLGGVAAAAAAAAGKEHTE